MKQSKRVRGLVVAVAAVGLTVSGCAGGQTAEEAATELEKTMNAVSYDCNQPDASTTTEVSVAAVPIVSNSAIYAGIDNGSFEKHGLSVTVTPVNAVAASIAAVQGGSTDFAFAGMAAALQAIDQGIPLTVVAPFAGIAPGYWDKMQAGEPGYTREVTALLVAPDSGIDDPGDLNGKTVAVNDVKGQTEITARYVIKAHGGDPDTVNFTMLSFADAINALMAGQVDAAMSLDPQMAPAEAAGYKIISWPGVETLHEGPTSAIVSSHDYVVNNAETVARFECAIREATEFANENPDEIRRITAREQGVDPASLAKATVPYFYQSIDLEGLKRHMAIFEEVGAISPGIDIASVVIPQAID